MRATVRSGSRSRSRTSAFTCCRCSAASRDTGGGRAPGNVDRPAIRICVTLSATAAADSGASVAISADSVSIMPIIR